MSENKQQYETDVLINKNHKVM